MQLSAISIKISTTETDSRSYLVLTVYSISRQYLGPAFNVKLFAEGGVRMKIRTRNHFVSIPISVYIFEHNPNENLICVIILS